MPTINQLIKHPRTDKVKKSKVPAMQQNPQKRGANLVQNPRKYRKSVANQWEYNPV